MAQLIDILNSKQPSYVRCVKPNDNKQPGVLNEEIVRHQVKYLGLMENLRVRRAGFAYRRHYEQFLKRYKPLCPVTWPNYAGAARQGVAEICSHLSHIYTHDDYSLGRTKIFIRLPRTLFATEDALALRKHDIATRIQAKYKAYHQRQVFIQQKHAVTCISKYWRRVLAIRLLQRRRKAAQQIRSFIRGFMMRHLPICDENQLFIRHMRYNYLMRLCKQLPHTILDKTWPTCPQQLKDASEVLQQMHTSNMVRSYCKHISEQHKWQFEQKVVGESLFKNKKQSYISSIAEPYAETRLVGNQFDMCKATFKRSNKHSEESVKYVVPVIKYDRKGYNTRNRCLLLSNSALYTLEEKNFKLKECVPYDKVKSVSVSSFSDSLFVIHIDIENNGNKGDLILQSDYVIEILVKLSMLADLHHRVDIAQTSITHSLINGKHGIIEFTVGEKTSIGKSKSGNLTVMSRM